MSCGGRLVTAVPTAIISQRLPNNRNLSVHALTLSACQLFLQHEALALLVGELEFIDRRWPRPPSFGRMATHAKFI
jgi:hypothetical protein